MVLPVFHESAAGTSSSAAGPDSNRRASADLSDSEAVSRCRAGESAVYEILVRRYENRVFGLLYALTSDPELARDLTQDTFIRAWRKLDLYDPARSFLNWLYAIARNLSRDHHRRCSAVCVPLGESEEEISLPDPGPLPDANLATADMRFLIRTALEQLSLTEKEILVLKDIQERSYEEIAQILALPRGTVASRVHHARRALARRLEQISLRDGLAPDELFEASAATRPNVATAAQSFPPLAATG